MRNKYKMFPLVFLLFGLILISAIAGSSIRKHVKNSGNNNATSKNVSINKTLSIEKEGKKEEKIFFNKPEKAPSKTSIKVYKKRRIMELYGDGELIGRFKIGLGRSPEGDKEKEGDNRTPEGSYYICYKNSQTKYSYFIGISYPNIKDAENGLNRGVINQATYNKIKKAIDNNQQPLWNTPLGGAVGIHGGGTKYDWTYGCIALSNEDLDILKQYTPMKTPIDIYK